MTERLQPPHASDRRPPRRRLPRRRAVGVRGAQAVPVTMPGSVVADTGPTILGFPAEEVPREDDDPEPSIGEPPPDLLPSDVALAVVRRADWTGGGALVLAGVAANASLTLSWWPGEGPTGLSLVQHGVEDLRSGAGGIWQPLVVVLCGGLLVLLGVLLLVPARAHRLVGVLALFVALAAATAVVLLVEIGWGVDQFGPGMWCAVAVPVLGVLGALKAMLTPPLLTLTSR